MLSRDKSAPTNLQCSASAVE